MTTDEPRRPSARAQQLLSDAIVATARQDFVGYSRASRALLAYLADLEATVGWYADPAHYGDSAKRIITADGSFANVCSVLADGGARARAVAQ